MFFLTHGVHYLRTGLFSLSLHILEIRNRPITHRLGYMARMHAPNFNYAFFAFYERQPYDKAICFCNKVNCLKSHHAVNDRFIQMLNFAYEIIYLALH